MSIAFVAGRRAPSENEYDNIVLVEEYTAGVRGVVVPDVYEAHEQSSAGPLFDEYDQVISIADWKTWTVTGLGRLHTSHESGHCIREYKYVCERRTRQGDIIQSPFWEDEIKLKPRQLYRSRDIVRLPRNRDNWIVSNSTMEALSNGNLSYRCELIRIKRSTGRPATGDDPRDVKTVWQEEIAGHSS